MLSVVSTVLTTPRDVVQLASQCGCAVNRCDCSRLQTIAPLSAVDDLCGHCGHAAMYHTKRISSLAASRLDVDGLRLQYAPLLRQSQATEMVLKQKLRMAASGTVSSEVAVALVHEVFKGCVALLDELGLARSRAVHNEAMQEDIFRLMRSVMAVCDEAERHLSSVSQQGW